MPLHRCFWRHLIGEIEKNQSPHKPRLTGNSHPARRGGASTFGKALRPGYPFRLPLNLLQQLPEFPDLPLRVLDLNQWTQAVLAKEPDRLRILNPK